MRGVNRSRRAVVTPEFIDIEAPPIMRAIIGHVLDHADVVVEDRQGRPVLRRLPRLAAGQARLRCAARRHRARGRRGGLTRTRRRGGAYLALTLGASAKRVV